MHVGLIHVDPSVLANQGLSQAQGGAGAAKHRAGGASFAETLQHAAAPLTAAPLQHARAVAEGRLRPQRVKTGGGRGRHHPGDEADYAADEAAYQSAVEEALGDGRPRAAQLAKTQGLVFSGIGMFNMQRDSGDDDEG